MNPNIYIGVFIRVLNMNPNILGSLLVFLI